MKENESYSALFLFVFPLVFRCVNIFLLVIQLALGLFFVGGGGELGHIAVFTDLICHLKE